MTFQWIWDSVEKRVLLEKRDLERFGTEDGKGQGQMVVIHDDGTSRDYHPLGAHAVEVSRLRHGVQSLVSSSCSECPALEKGRWSPGKSAPVRYYRYSLIGRGSRKVLASDSVLEAGGVVISMPNKRRMQLDGVVFERRDEDSLSGEGDVKKKDKSLKNFRMQLARECPLDRPSLSEWIKSVQYGSEQASTEHSEGGNTATETAERAALQAGIPKDAVERAVNALHSVSTRRGLLRIAATMNHRHLVHHLPPSSSPAPHPHPHLAGKRLHEADYCESRIYLEVAPMLETMLSASWGNAAASSGAHRAAWASAALIVGQINPAYSLLLAGDLSKQTSSDKERGVKTMHLLATLRGRDLLFQQSEDWRLEAQALIRTPAYMSSRYFTMYSFELNAKVMVWCDNADAITQFSLKHCQSNRAWQTFLYEKQSCFRGQRTLVTLRLLTRWGIVKMHVPSGIHCVDDTPLLLETTQGPGRFLAKHGCKTREEVTATTRAMQHLLGPWLLYELQQQQHSLLHVDEGGRFAAFVALQQLKLDPAIRGVLSFNEAEHYMCCALAADALTTGSSARLAVQCSCTEVAPSRKQYTFNVAINGLATHVVVDATHIGHSTASTESVRTQLTDALHALAEASASTADVGRDDPIMPAREERRNNERPSCSTRRTQRFVRGASLAGAILHASQPQPGATLAVTHLVAERTVGICTVQHCSLPYVHSWQRHSALVPWLHHSIRPELQERVGGLVRRRPPAIRTDSAWLYLIFVIIFIRFVDLEEFSVMLAACFLLVELHRSVRHTIQIVRVQWARRRQRRRRRESYPPPNSTLVDFMIYCALLALEMRSVEELGALAVRCALHIILRKCLEWQRLWQWFDGLLSGLGNRAWRLLRLGAILSTFASLASVATAVVATPTERAASRIQLARLVSMTLAAEACELAAVWLSYRGANSRRGRTRRQARLLA